VTGADVVGYAFTSLISIVLMGGAAWFAFGRHTLTKEVHEEICSGKQALVYAELKHIREQQAKMDVKLDRILMNGRGRG